MWYDMGRWDRDVVYGVMGQECAVLVQGYAVMGHACGVMGHNVVCDMAWNLLFSFKSACRSTIRGSRIQKPPGLQITPLRPCCLSDAALSLFCRLPPVQ